MATQILADPRIRTLARHAVLLNDIHSQLNPTVVAEVAQPRSVADVVAAVHRAAAAGRAVAIAGGRHAMGGQQFATGGTVLSMSGMDRVLDLDTERGQVEVDAGIQWPRLIRELHRLQRNAGSPWTIAQKQTGADRLSIGGAVAANVHGRALAMRPFVGDVEALTIVTADGSVLRCSRRENRELFQLAVGGYGLFGVVTQVRLRLTRQQKLRRTVEILNLDELPSAFASRIADGFTYGDFQFAIDNDSPEFLRRGVFSCYQPVDPSTPIPQRQVVLSEKAWRELLHLAHCDKSAAFQRYGEHYLRTSGQIYESDTHQLATYLDDYHRELDDRSGSACRGSEMISELYVPRDAIPRFMEAVADDFRSQRVNCIYGTVRLTERDDETFLAWAREPWACVIFNIHTDHSPEGLRASARIFRRLIDRAAETGGSYYLTYHRHARKDQVVTCHPRFREFLDRKRRYDRDELFRSDWYAHYSRMFGPD
ncbi:MAG TPA: FAD-binding oxidoreductase [Gemmatimonadaceae bacterium]|nr:FAD-binding oxidoreductase [Gemmatimonadaceae bacterium]